MTFALLQPNSTIAPDGAPVVLAAAATGLVDFIEAQGGDVDSIFGNSGIAPDMAGAPTLKVKLSSYCRLFEEAARQIRSSHFSEGNFGLWFGQPVPAPRSRPVGLCGGLGADAWVRRSTIWCGFSTTIRNRHGCGWSGVTAA